MACVGQPQPEPPLSGDDDGRGLDAGAGDGDADSDADADSDSDGDLDGECAPADATVVTLQTDDGLSLAADFHPAGVAGAAAVLLHMAPTSGFDRTDWPIEFIDALARSGVSVLAVDRRGAGESEGDAADAAGPAGWLDAKAAYDFLGASACGIDTTRIAWIGASNGTTTALDFAIAASGDAALDDVAALVFLTGGLYTENQNAISDNVYYLGGVPILFVYQPSESDWSLQFQGGAPESWEFLEVTGGHGTEIFGIDPTVGPSILAFLSRRI
jgi:pimeloyl-ACP methyl ester carboxylesterase